MSSSKVRKSFTKLNDQEEDTSKNGQHEDNPEQISGWADSMLKILKSTKPKNKKNFILSRARKDYEVPKNPNQVRRKDDDLQIAKAEKPMTNDVNNGEEAAQGVKKEIKKEDDVLSFKEQRKLELKQRKLEHAWENLNRLTSTEPDREMETDLMKIATKGVVQLFNAVAQQQKTLKTKLRASSKSEFKKEKVLAQSKDMFDKAMSKNKIVGKNDDSSIVEVKDESMSENDDSDTEGNLKQRKRKARIVAESSSSKRPVWQALQDDFMLDAKLKDWDKESESDSD